MLTVTVIIIALILIVANFDIVIGLVVWTGILAVGLAVLAAVIGIFVTWTRIAIVSCLFFALMAYFFSRELKKIEDVAEKNNKQEGA